MSKADLKMVTEPVPYDEAKNRKRIESLKSQLMAESLRFIREGATKVEGNSQMDRLRTISDVSGIPRTILEVEIKK